MPIKHARGYYEGHLSEYIIKGVSSYYDTTNKKVYEKIGISKATYYRLKAGKEVNNETKNKVKGFFKNINSKDQKILARVVDKIARTGKKELSKKEIKAIEKKYKKEIEENNKKLSKVEKEKIYKDLFYNRKNK